MEWNQSNQSASATRRALYNVLYSTVRTYAQNSTYSYILPLVLLQFYSEYESCCHLVEILREKWINKMMMVNNSSQRVLESV